MCALSRDGYGHIHSGGISLLVRFSSKSMIWLACDMADMNSAGTSW